MDQILRMSKKWRLIAILGVISICVLGAKALVPTSSDFDSDRVKSFVINSSKQSITCVGHLNLSIGSQGFAVLEPEMFLMGSYSDYGRFEVEAMDPTVVGDTVTCEHVGMTMMVSVTDTITGDICMSEITINDKIAPSFDCIDAEVPCYTDMFDESQFEDNPDEYLENLNDNCTAIEDLEVEFTILDRENFFCSNPDYVGRIVGKWTLTDEAGLTSTCTQNINLVKPDLDSIVFPADTMFQCGMENTDTSSTGYPTLNGRRLESICGVSILMEDDSISMCGNEYKIEREWTLMTVCPPMEMRMETQVIEVKDTTAPVISCPSDQVVNTDPGECSTDFEIIIPEIMEDCIDSADLNYEVYVDGVLESDPIVNLEQGDHTITVEVTNMCTDDFKSDTCSYTVTVVDNEPPTVPSCVSEVTLQLGADGVTTYPVSAFDNVYDDNCEIVDTTVMRLTAGCGFNGSEPPMDSLTVCCDDINQTVEVMFVVEDGNGNTNGCTISVTVQDALDPTTVFCPSDTTVSCDSIADLSMYGEPVFEDNCEVDTILYSEETVLNACREGTITRTWTAEDQSGNSEVCVQVLNVENDEAFDSLDITYPDDITLSECNVNPLDTSLTGGVFVDYNGCSVLGITFEDDTLENGACLVLERTFEVYDSCTESIYDGAHNITILNYGEPELSAPSDTTVYLNSDSCTLNVTLEAATVSFCSPEATIENNLTSGGAIVDYNFPLGSTEVIYTATDTCGNVSVDTTLVEVLDTIPPSVSCPPDTTVEVGQGDCEVFVDVSLPQIDEACDIDSIYNNYTSTPEADSLYGIGETEVTYYVVDESGLLDSCTFTVTVVDTDPIELMCPASDTVYADVNCEATVPDLTDDVDVMMNCPGSATITISQNPSPGSIINSDTSVQVIATDGMTADTCLIDLILQDTIPPTLEGPDTLVVTIDGECEYTIPDVSDTVTITENCGADSVIITQFPQAGEEFMYEGDDDLIEVIATDTSGNSDTIEIVLDVQDNTPPIIACPDDIVQGNDVGECAAFVNVPIPTTDNVCGQDSIYNDRTGEGEASDDYPVGTTEVTYYAEDIYGNVDSCKMNITVEDQEAPVLGCPADTSQVAVNEDCEYIVPNFVDSITVTDNCVDSVELTFNQIPAAGTILATDTTVQIIVSDTSMNADTCEVYLEAVDTITPMLSCPQPVNEIALNENCEYTVPNYQDSIEVMDNCLDSTELTYTQLPAAGAVLSMDTTVLLIVSDAMNSDTCSITIDAVDETPPLISCPSDTVVGNDAGVCEADVTLMLPEVSDNCDSDVEITNNQNGGSSASGVYGVGVHTIIYTATDNAGNSATCSFTLTVEDQEAPMINCPADTLDLIVDENCEYTVPNLIDQSMATDNCVESNQLIYTQDVAPGSIMMGDTTVTIIVTDTSSNSDTCMVYLNPVDTIPPTVTAPDTITRALDISCTYTLEDFRDSLILSDNCDTEGELIVEYDPTVGTEFNGVGVEDIEVIVSDISGNSDTTTFALNLIDTIAPEIICPDDVEVDVSGGACEIFVDVPSPTVSDSCGIDSIYNSYTSTQEADSLYSIGDTEVTYYVVDESGQIDSCTFTVTVVDTDPIELMCPPTDTVYADGDCEATIPDYEEIVDVMMNCPGLDTIMISQTPLAGTVISEDTLVEVIATNGTTSDTCLIPLTFQDTIPPTLEGPDTLTVQIDSTCQYVIPDVSDTTSVVENCGLETIEQFPSAGDTIAYNGEDDLIEVVASDTFGNTDTLIIILDVIDTVPPVITCADDITVSNDPGVCEAFVNVLLPDTDSVCGADSIYNDRTNLPDASDIYPVGSTEVTFYAMDVNGNIDSCKLTVTVEDNEPPVLNCPSTDTTYLNEDCVATVKDYFDTLNVMDNCDGTDIFYDQSIPAGDTISTDTTITIIVGDSAGNMDTCMFDIVVHDSIAPVVSGPDTITVIADENCEYTVPNALDSITIAENCSQDSLTIIQNPPADTTIESFNEGDSIVIVVEDEYGNVDSFIITLNVIDTLVPMINCPADTMVDCGAPLDDLSDFGEPSVMNDCDLDTIIEEVQYFEDSCAIDSIVRTFTAFDRGGNSSSCSQTIQLGGTVRELTRQDFILEDTIFLESCDDSLNPEFFPVLDSSLNLCNKFGIDSIVDTYFPPVLNCRKFERVYQIHDSCFHDPNAPEGDVILKQFFFVYDTIEPVVNAPADITVTAGSDCTAEVDLPPATAFDCAEIQSYFNDSPFADSSGADASGTYPVGTHTVTFFASDSCEMEGSDVTMITVLPGDITPISCNPPDGPVSIEEDGTVELNANDYVDLNDTCRMGELTASWDPVDQSDSLRIITCDSLTGGSYTFNGTITVYFEGEPVSSCDITIFINDPNGFCGIRVAGDIFGTVNNWEGRPVQNVEISLHNGGQIVQQTQTDETGNYIFKDVQGMNSYTITFEKDDYPLNGVSTYDLLLMYKTVMGEDMFVSPYQTLASDINKSAALSLIDVVNLKQMILGYKQQFNDGKTWFVNEAEFDIEEYLNNSSSIEYDNKYDIGFLNTESKEVDMIATKKGDVNGSYVNGLNRAVEYRSDVQFDWTIEKDRDGNRITITAGQDLDIEGMQLALELGVNVEEVHSSLNDFSEADYRYSDDVLRIAYANDQVNTIKKGDVLFVIETIQETKPELKDQILASEVYLEGKQQASLRLESLLKSSDSDNYALYNAEPNPMMDKTRIGFNLPSKEKVDIRVYDQNGKMIIERSVKGNRGYNTIEVSAESLPKSGVYYYQLSTDEFTATKRFVKM